MNKIEITLLDLGTIQARRRPWLALAFVIITILGLFAIFAPTTLLAGAMLWDQFQLAHIFISQGYKNVAAETFLTALAAAYGIYSAIRNITTSILFGITIPVFSLLGFRDESDKSEDN